MVFFFTLYCNTRALHNINIVKSLRQIEGVFPRLLESERGDRTVASGPFRAYHWLLELQYAITLIFYNLRLDNGDMASFLEYKFPRQIDESFHIVRLPRRNFGRSQFKFHPSQFHPFSWSRPRSSFQESPSTISITSQLRFRFCTTKISPTNQWSN